MRQERKVEVERHVEAVNRMLRELRRDGSSSADETDNEVLSAAGEWKGFDEAMPAVDVDHQDEYIDEDRFTTVTVEAIDVSRNGLRTVAKEQRTDDHQDSESKETSQPTGANIAKVSSNGISKRTGHTKSQRSRSFRYESKAERKATKRIQHTARARKRRPHQ